eukprot:CFRG0880T1
MGDVLSDTVNVLTSLFGVELQQKAQSSSRYSNARRPRNREERYQYLEPFVLKQHRTSCDNQHQFLEIGRGVRTLLHECYDFRVRFGLSPDSTTQVNASFSSGLEGTVGKRDLAFSQAGAGEASVKLVEESYVFKAALSTADVGSMNALFRIGRPDSNAFIRGITNLESAEVHLYGGAAVKANQYAFSCEMDALSPKLGVNATGIYKIGESVTFGARYRSGLGDNELTHTRVMDAKMCVRGESLDSKYAQPQDYEINAHLLDNGRTLTTSYLHNMMIPIAGRLHRFSMGGEFVHHGSENIFVKTSSRMSQPRQPARTIPRSPRPVSWAPGVSHDPRDSIDGSGGLAVGGFRPRAESEASRPREAQYVVRNQPSTNHLTVGMSWQPSDIAMMKVRVDHTANVGGLIAFKTWGRVGPNLTVALSLRTNALNPHTYKAGVCVDMTS